jgi:hypothetical protein
VIRVVLLLILATVGLDVAWPQSARDAAARQIAASICASKPRPAACAPDGRPGDVLKPFIGLATPPPPPNPKETKR